MHAVFDVITYSMAAGSIGPTGPLQQGRGVHGQYVYWACQAHPSEGNPHGILGPANFSTRQAFCEFVVTARND